MNPTASTFPNAAYAPGTDVLWWDLDFHPGSEKRKYGAENKLAAWLAFNIEVGERFTMPQLRRALGDGIVPNNAEHLNRRLRSLREVGWQLPTMKDDALLLTGQYQLLNIGWHPGVGKRPKRNSISKTTRRLVFERDNSRCVICGVAAGEPYPDGTGAICSITVGHRIPNARKGSSKDINNLQAECKHCNEPVRQEIRSPETIEEVLPLVLKLSKNQAVKLYSWVVKGSRTRDSVDELYDRVRKMTGPELTALKVTLEKKVGV